MSRYSAQRGLLMVRERLTVFALLMTDSTETALKLGNSLADNVDALCESAESLEGSGTGR